jgi:hypothetical protein
VVAKLEWHAGELFPRVGFIVTNRKDPARGIVHFYNGRGTCEQWIKEGKYAFVRNRLINTTGIGISRPPKSFVKRREKMLLAVCDS